MADKHHYAKELMQYAEDAQTTGKPWLLWECRNLEDNPDVDSSVADFITLDSEPEWKLGWEYRRKPVTLSLVNVTIPKPAQEPLYSGQKYYLMRIGNPNVPEEQIWRNDTTDYRWLKANLIYSKNEDAVSAAEMLILAITRGH